MRARTVRRRSSQAGFTLIETLLAATLFVIVVVALATITGQWLPNWNRGFVHVQRAERLAFGIERIVSDLAGAQFISPNATIKRPIFDGTELSVLFVRGAVGPHPRPGLEFVRLSEVGGERGLVLTRTAAPFIPLEPDLNAIAGLKFSEPVVLVPPPYRVLFAYAGPDRVWKPTWRDADRLPSAVRISVRDMVSGQTLAVSSASVVHVNTPVGCVQATSCAILPTNANAAAAAAPAGR